MDTIEIQANKYILLRKALQSLIKEYKDEIELCKKDEAEDTDDYYEVLEEGDCISERICVYEELIDDLKRLLKEN